MPVEVLAGSVVAHRGLWVGVAGGDLDVVQVNTGVEHRGDEGVPEHVWVHPWKPHASFSGEASQPRGAMAVAF
jgi:hypothetical protein